jgi:hypothetical protein
MHIFVASSGRCGTGFLASCFKNYTYISANHEERPIVAGKLLIEANRNGTASKALSTKALEIKKNPFYIDTAHQFMRGFYKYALEEMPNLKVIKLVRNPIEVAVSKLNRKEIPGNSPWVRPPFDEDTLLRVTSEEWSSMSNLEKIFLDWFEHEHRFWVNKDLFDHVSYITFEELTKSPKVTVERVFNELGIKTRSFNNRPLYKNKNTKKTIYSQKEIDSFKEVEFSLREKYNIGWIDNDYYKEVLNYGKV